MNNSKVGIDYERGTEKCQEWFFNLRNDLVNTLEIIEGKKFNFKDWSHSGSGGGNNGSIKGKSLKKEV